VYFESAEPNSRFDAVAMSTRFGSSEGASI
jgi:hypothetical protein